MSEKTEVKRLLSIAQSPLQEVLLDSLTKKNVRLFIKRDDLLHPLVSGNKWRKLRYNLNAVKEEGKETLLTFGGAYSNHIHAVAAAGQTLGFKTIGLIRGEEPSHWSPTLRFAQTNNMDLHFLSRTAYRQKQIPEFIDLENSYLLPEGGTNDLAILGCREIVPEVLKQMNVGMPDYWCLSAGTGGTSTGLIAELAGKSKVLSFSALKGDFLRQEIKAFQKRFELPLETNWQLITDYHFGGYARYQPKLIDFMKSFYKDTGIPLDPVYTGKLCYGIFDLIEKDFFPQGSQIVMVHTGGLQGIAGFNERFGLDLPEGKE